MNHIHAKIVSEISEHAFGVGKRSGTGDVTHSVDGHFSTEPSAPPTIRLFIADCETQRFTVEGPLAIESIDAWYREVDRASDSGRYIFCVPIGEMQPGEIIEMGEALGYQHWPPLTIVAPLPKRQSENLDRKQLASRDRNYLRRVLSARNGNGNDWLREIRKMANRLSKAS